MGKQQYALYSRIAICTTKKTRKLDDVPHQPHALRHRHRRPIIPKQPPLLSTSQKHEQRPQENSRRSHGRRVDKGGEIYGGGI